MLSPAFLPSPVIHSRPLKSLPHVTTSTTRHLERRRSTRACAPPSSSSPASIPSTNANTALVQTLWKTFNTGSFTSASPLFSPEAVYHDTLYAKPFVGRPAIHAHFAAMERAFEDGLVYVIDDVTGSGMSAAARWHVELETGARLPFARGASTYKFVEEEGRLVFIEAWDFPEPTFKAAVVLLPVLSIAVKLLRRYPGLLPAKEGGDGDDER